MSLDSYKRRLGHTDRGNVLANQTIKNAKRIHGNSPLYKEIEIEGNIYGVRVNMGKKSTDRKLLFTPNTYVDIGDMVSYENKSWMIVDFFPSDIYPKGIISICVNSIFIKHDGSEYEYPAIFKGGNFDLSDKDEFMFLEDGKLTAQIKYDEFSKRIKISEEYIINGRTYSIVGIDNVSKVFNDKGILILTLEVTSSSVPVTPDEDGNESDDKDSGWGGGW